MVLLGVSPAPPVQPVNGSVTEPLLTRAPANSSARLGARTSRDCRAMMRTSSRVLSHGLPTFQESTAPELVLALDRPARLRSSLPKVVSFSTGTLDSRNASHSWK